MRLFYVFRIGINFFRKYMEEGNPKKKNVDKFDYTKIKNFCLKKDMTKKAKI